MQQHQSQTPEPVQTDHTVKDDFTKFNQNRIANGSEPYTFEQYNDVLQSLAALVESKPTREQLEAMVMPSVSKIILGQ